MSAFLNEQRTGKNPKTGKKYNDADFQIVVYRDGGDTDDEDEDDEKPSRNYRKFKRGKK